MSKKVVVDYTGRVVTFHDIEQEIIKNRSNQTGFKNIVISDPILQQLELMFPDKQFNYLEWSKLLFVIDSISTSFVLSHKLEFLKCFEEFDSVSHELMKLLSNTFNLNFGNLNELRNLKRNKSKNQRGTINEAWNYYFHGSECCFTNSITNQHVEVKIIYGQEYGVIDDYFLFKFIETTATFSAQYELLNKSSDNLRKVISVFEREGYLIRKLFFDSKGLVLNKNKKR
ncbi:DUF6896 domain-containing protein [Sediminitomix flava]|uniref:DUF6896 domain-containing protein n=1 Tax=Sediminitomix flava TaxID=379075 RepID=A0A315YVE5_SEDFL|nr:hypothetical protein [Sediminitomix flava]PWJ32899.1 hypothetical protein BC781_1185 [Sediminitomix flava]